ncbi:MAG TPA: TIGR03619 family F420-dependent LLM class oxidoreductase [Candidatus Micrarchaeaceae archaeon]|nr:TIGR03619 family F420-dependent LLM class oxidoreductase [Candidatus Micrarchaeaceae archaeon]
MKFGVAFHTAYFGVDPDVIAAYAQHAEACGFESFYMSEHVAMHRGSKVGGVALDPTVAIADPLEVLTFIAAKTQRILLGTAILQLPLHHPVMLAKRLATIDVLSKGRMRLLTVGLGALAGESAALGVDHATRGRRADEAIDILRLLWAGDENGVSFEGEFYSFTDVCIYPKPHHAGTIPIHIGGSTRASARRAGLRGDGYFPGGTIGRDERLRQIDLMRSVAKDAGRDVVFDITRWGPKDLTAAQVEAHAADQVTRLVVGPASLDPQVQRDDLTAFAERLGLI